MSMKNSACGSDFIEACCLKAGHSVFVPWLKRVIDSGWHRKTNRVPQEWKNATLQFLHKKGDKLDKDNYRGISLLSVPGKVYTRVLYNRIQPLIDAKLLDLQCGFRPGRGCSDQLHVGRRLCEIAEKHGTSIYFCLVDLKKAFD